MSSVGTLPGGSQNSAVTLITLVNGEHEWPTLQSAAHFPGTDAIWDFFSQHSLAASSSVLAHPP